MQILWQKYIDTSPIATVAAQGANPSVLAEHCTRSPSSPRAKVCGCSEPPQGLESLTSSSAGTKTVRGRSNGLRLARREPRDPLVSRVATWTPCPLPHRQGAQACSWLLPCCLQNKL